MRMKACLYWIAWLLVLGCKERYTPPITTPVTGYLVVEGYISNSPNLTSITLSRTTRLEDTAQIVYESGAQVRVEEKEGSSYPLTETGKGVYTAQTQLSNNSQYRLHIVTAGGKEYASEYTPVITTPVIDTLSWQRDGNGVHINILTHDEQNNPGFYQWTYAETWQFETIQRTLTYSLNPSTGLVDSLVYIDPIFHRVDTTHFRCWKTFPSTNIVIASTEKLSRNAIDLPLIDIPSASQQLSILYSLFVTQHAISRDHYQFLQRMKKNTEQLGSLFDAQPSELKGNLHCVSDANEIVVGYIEASDEQTKRIFISKEQVPDWNYTPECRGELIDNNAESINTKALYLYPTIPFEMIQQYIKNFFAYRPECVDCTLTGSNQKPSFWP